jgi:hypothetical protein
MIFLTREQARVLIKTYISNVKSIFLQKLSSGTFKPKILGSQIINLWEQENQRA